MVGTKEWIPNTSMISMTFMKNMRDVQSFQGLMTDILNRRLLVQF